MAQGYSLQEIQLLRDTAFQAYNEALSSKSYGVGSRNTTRQDLVALQSQLNYWDAMLQRMLGNGSQIVVKDLVSVDPQICRR